MIYVTYKALQSKLKEVGLPYSRTFLQLLENAGAIPKVENYVEFHKQTKGFSTIHMRIFTQEEIANIIDAVRVYRNGHTQIQG